MMEKHVHVAFVHKGLSWIYIAFAAIFAITYDVLQHRATNSWLILASSLICVGLFTLHYFLHQGTLKQQKWALNTTRAVAIPLLFWFPFGTLLGSYFLISCWDGWRSKQAERFANQTNVFGTDGFASGAASLQH